MIERVTRCDGCREIVADGSAVFGLMVSPECGLGITLHFCSGGCFETWAAEYAETRIAPTLEATAATGCRDGVNDSFAPGPATENWARLREGCP